MATGEHQSGSARRWTVRLRLVIEAANVDAARTVSSEALRHMGLVAGAGPHLTDFFVDSPKPCWYVITELDLSGLDSITPDDAPAWFKFVIRELPGVPFMGHGNEHCGLWEWLPGNRGSAGHYLFPQPGVRAAGIYVSDRPTSQTWPGSR